MDRRNQLEEFRLCIGFKFDNDLVELNSLLIPFKN